MADECMYAQWKQPTCLQLQDSADYRMSVITGSTQRIITVRLCAWCAQAKAGRPKVDNQT